jgi:hypothetical protein
LLACLRVHRTCETVDATPKGSDATPWLSRFTLHPLRTRMTTTLAPVTRRRRGGWSTFAGVMFLAAAGINGSLETLAAVEQL